MIKFFKKFLKFNIGTEKGWSLTELMVTVTILGLTSTAAANVYINGQRSYIYLQGNTKNIQIARSGIDVLARQVRTTIQITSATSNSMSFEGDFDGDGDINVINFTLNTGTHTISRTIDGLTSQLSEGIINTTAQPMFIYYDQDDNQITEPSLYIQAKKLKITLYVDDNINEVPNRPIELSTNIQLRNLHERR